jgi:hypothetical protein
MGTGAMGGCVDRASDGDGGWMWGCAKGGGRDVIVRRVAYTYLVSVLSYYILTIHTMYISLYSYYSNSSSVC